jgi:hypothetical protein
MTASSNGVLRSLLQAWGRFPFCVAAGAAVLWCAAFLTADKLEHPTLQSARQIAWAIGGAMLGAGLGILGAVAARQNLNNLRQQEAEIRDLRRQAMERRSNNRVQDGAPSEPVVQMLERGRFLSAIGGVLGLIACGVWFWWWMGTKLSPLGRLWASDPEGSFYLLVQLETLRFMGFLAGAQLGVLAGLPFLFIGFRRQRDLEIAWKQEKQWLREKLGLPAETCSEPSATVTGVRISPGRLRFLVIRKSVRPSPTSF